MCEGKRLLRRVPLGEPILLHSVGVAERIGHGTAEVDDAKRINTNSISGKSQLSAAETLTGAPSVSVEVGLRVKAQRSSSARLAR